MFNGDDLAQAMGVPLFYGIVEAILLAIYCLISWKLNWTKAPSDDPFFKVISVSYEVLLTVEELAKEEREDRELPGLAIEGDSHGEEEEDDEFGIPKKKMVNVCDTYDFTYANYTDQEDVINDNNRIQGSNNKTKNKPSSRSRRVIGRLRSIRNSGLIRSLFSRSRDDHDEKDIQNSF